MGNMDILTASLDTELSDFLYRLFEKYDIRLDSELVYNLAVEQDFYNIVLAIEQHIKDVVKLSEVQ